jgi:uncharacterized protein YodC (DUF2158 family)
MKQVGDIVRLKAGGPLMTVTAYTAKSHTVECCWVAESDGSPQDAPYPEGALDGPFVIRSSSVGPLATDAKE